MQENPVSSKHLGYLDGVRALAAIWVVMSHCWCTVIAQLSGFAIGVMTIFSRGRMPVDMFIVLSGFCLMLPVINSGGILRGGVFEFIKRRAWRILPPYYCATAFSLLMILLFIHDKTGTIWDNAIPTTLTGIVTHVLLIHDAFPRTYEWRINYAFWSIAVEWRIYFFFPLLVLGWRFIGPVKTLVLGLAASWVLHRLSLHLIDATLTLNYLGLFTMGMFGAAVAFPTSPWLQRWRALPWGWITLAMFLLVVALYCVPHLDRVKGEIPEYAVGLLATSILVVTAIKRDSWHYKMLSYPPLAFTGTFAYSIYLIHAPLLQLLWQYPYARLQPHPTMMLVALLLSIPGIVGVAYLFFLLFERPFLRKKKKPAVAPAQVLSGDMKLEGSGPSPV